MMQGHELLPVAHDEETETEDALHQASYLRHDSLRLRAVVRVCVGLLAVVLLIGVAVFRVGGSFFEKRTSTLDLDYAIVKVGHSFLQASETVTKSTSTATQLAPMFCWSVVRANSYEVPLVTQQYWRKASIFECDEYDVYSHGGPSWVGPLVVMTIDEQSVGVGDVQEVGTTTSSWLNTMVFIRAWQLVLEGGKWWAHEWTVKVDPDAVFFPHRLKMKVHDHYPAGEVNGPAWYVANCDRSWNAEPLSLKVFGSFEVYSRNALSMYKAHQQECKDELNWKGWGEDYFMQQCMQKMGVEVINGVSFLGDSRCYPALCSDTSKVTFHAYKDEDSWFACWDESRAAGAWIASETIFLQK